jgi:hypothetical protein
MVTKLLNRYNSTKRATPSTEYVLNWYIESRQVCKHVPINLQRKIDEKVVSTSANIIFGIVIERLE